MSLSEQDIEALATAVCRRDDYGNFVPRHLNAAVEQIVARHVAAALTEAADAIKSTSTDPDRRRPRATNAEVSTDFANDLQWAEQIVRDHIPKDAR